MTKARKTPIRILASSLTSHIYAVTRYTYRGDGILVAHTKYDVTSDIEAIIASRLKLITTPATSSTEAIIQYLENEDRANDPDDLYTGRAHRVAAVRKLLGNQSTEAGGAWRDIASAPRDGTHIVVPSQWSGMEIDEVTFDPTIPGGFEWWSVKIEEPIDPPKYWMPLPPPPTGAGE